MNNSRKTNDFAQPEGSATDHILQALMNAGIQISQEDISVSDLIKSGYRELDGEAAVHISALISHVFQFGNTKIGSSVSNKTVQQAINGTFRVKLDPGYHLGVSHKVPGAFSANVFDAEGALRGPTALFPNETLAEIPRLSEYVSHAFNAASLVTGQYFMKQINQSLEHIQVDTAEIKRIFSIQQISKLSALHKSLLDILDHRKFTNSNPSRRQADIDELRHIKREVLELISVYQLQLKDKREHANLKKDDYYTIVEVITNIARSILLYQMAVQLLCTVLITEIYLEGITDNDELELYKRDMENSIDAFLRDSHDNRKWIAQYLEKASKINDFAYLPSTEHVLTMPFHGDGLTAAIGRFSIFSLSLIKEKKESSRAKKKKDLTTLSKQLLDELEDSSELARPIKDISEYIEHMKKPIEFVAMGNSVFVSPI